MKYVLHYKSYINKIKLYENVLNNDYSKFNAHEILSDYNKAYSWCINYSDVDINLYTENPNDYNIMYKDGKISYLKDIIYNYMYIYRKATQLQNIQIYRMVRLDNINSLNIMDVGVYWSFNQKGAGVYFTDNIKSNYNNDFLLNAIIDFNSINWLAGFNNYLKFGNYEIECNLLKGKDVTITHINGVELEEPIKGKS